MEKNNEILGVMPVGKLLRRLAIPAITAQLINMLYNMVDRIYIGHIPGAGGLALTGLGVCMPIIMIVSAFAALVSMGGAPRASISMGQKDNADAERIMGNCLALLVLIGLVMTALTLVFGRNLLLAFGASENTIGYALGYLRIYALGTLFVQLALGMNAFITAQGFATTSMLSVLIGAICNIILDPIFIFVLNMGVQGAALATILSQAVSAIWVIAFLCGKKTILRLRPHNIRLNPRVVLPCLALGTAPFIMQASESVLSVCFNSSLLRYGGDIAVGAMTILTSVIQLMMLPLQGLSQGAQPITSYSFGARNPGRVRAVFRLLLRACLVYSVLLWAIAMAFPQMLARIFTPDAELVAYAAWALRIYMGATAVMGVQIACQMTFIAIGSAPSSIIVAVLRKFVLLIPLIYILPTLLPNQVMAVYLAEPISDFLAVLFTWALFSVRFKKALSGIENAPQ